MRAKESNAKVTAAAVATRWSLSVRATPTLLPGASDPANDVSTGAGCPFADSHHGGSSFRALVRHTLILFTYDVMFR